MKENESTWGLSHTALLCVGDFYNLLRMVDTAIANQWMLHDIKA
jgi:hypothetical protein